MTYLTPLVGVVLDVLVLDEQPAWHEPVGGIVVIVSVMLVQRRRVHLRAPSGREGSREI